MRAPLLAILIGAGLCAGAAALAVDAPSVTIAMQKESFVPAQKTVAAGTRITWTNNDTVPHSVTTSDNHFDSGPIPPGKTFEWTADGSGTIAYHCIFHPSMTAELTIRSATNDAQ